MLHLGPASDHVSLFLSRKVANARADALQGNGAIARVVPAVRREPDRSTSQGFAVRYREPLGAWQLA